MVQGEVELKLTDALELALKWADQGVPVFPIALRWSEEKQSIDKVPLTLHGFKDASVNPDGIRAMFKKGFGQQQGDEMGVGLVPGPGGFIVLDVDVKGGAPGKDELDALTEEHGYLNGMVVDTASGGLHVWLRRPYEAHIGNSPIAPHIDIRCDAGYVVAPGTTSRWGDWRKSVGTLAEAEQMPANWAALLNARRDDGSREPIAEKLTAGQRHAALARMAGAMRRQGATEEEMLVALRTMNTTRCDPPKPDDELVKMARDFAEYEAEPDEAPIAVKLRGRLLGTAQTQEWARADSENGIEPLDLRALLSGDRPADDWLVKPLLPLGKLVGIVSKRGVGKSLLILDVACALASGTATLLQEEGEPIHIVYLDMEMGSDDLYGRLEDLGWTLDNPLFDVLAAHLHYYQLVGLPPLDTEKGGDALEALIDRHGASLVIVDTVSRVISGTENDAEPFRDMFRHTESRLKRRGITLARLDHMGKDASLGSRGSSAKEDPLDVVWHVEDTGLGSLHLKLTKGRMTWLPREFFVAREGEDGTTNRHTMAQPPLPEWLLPLVDQLDDLGLHQNATRKQALELAKKHGLKVSTTRMAEAVKFRKQRLKNLD